ncbi:sporulation integral membrane protein YtvI [Brevibacillus dissolubilis]|uniref:sporulation integral membrane protein YtvI n=1 Tax=Brevibacillus dissolubilis TaxID=1844116 RepID=UPI0011170259|nr:sporulation integral membrane protein YtvI [Brevibacillus dissolubilis]
MVLVSGLFYGILFVTPLIYPFLISLVIALMMNRPVTYLTEKTRTPRWLWVTVMLLLVLTVMFGLLTLVVTSVIVEISQLISMMPHLVNDLTTSLHRLITQDFITGLYSRFEFFYTQLDEQYQDTINTNVENGLKSISKAGQELVLSILGGVKSFLVSLPNLATVLVISLLGAFFISKDFYLWETRFRRMLPYGINRRMDQILIDLRNALVGFVRAQVTLISITAAIVIIGLLILDVDYAITIGLLTGFVDLLPYLGTGTVFVPWIVYAFFKGQYGLTIGLAVLYGVVVIFRQIIEPKIVAENVGLDPLMTLVALFIGLNLFGFLGLIIGPVSLVIINALVKANVFYDIWLYIKGTNETKA